MSDLSEQDREALTVALFEPDDSCAHNMIPLYAEVDRIVADRLAFCVGVHDGIRAQAVREARIEALVEAANEVHIEARWQAEQKARLAGVSDLRAGIQYNASLQRLAIVEQVLLDRADFLAVDNLPATSPDPALSAGEGAE